MSLIETEITSRALPIDPEIEADAAKFQQMLDAFQAGDLEEEVFKTFRLSNGIYGQRQGGTNQMLRVKFPYGSATPEQLEMIAHLCETYSRGWAHITTRQNFQMHYVQLNEVPSIMRQLGSVGLTTREACSDTVRNVMGCHLAGACPYEVLDISAWADAAFHYFLRNPISQRLPRKFKINFSGCSTDCGQAMFNDIGVVAASRTREDGSIEPGFRVYVAGGLGANPHEARALEDFTPRESLMATLEAVVRTFEQTGNRDNKLRARMKWVVDTLGWEETQRRILRSRRFLPASVTWPDGIPDVVRERGDAPAGAAVGVEPTPVGQGTLVFIGRKGGFEQWCNANVVRGVGNGTVSATASAELGDVTAVQLRSLAAIQRDLGLQVRTTPRQNLVFRGLTEDQLPVLYTRLNEIGMATPGAELARDVVSCPGADTCNLAVTQSRGLAKAIGDRLEEEGLAEISGVRINISGCTNSCGQHHISDIGFYGAERRAHGQSAPGYQMLIGGYVGEEQAHFGEKVLRLPAKAAPEAAAYVVERFATERNVGEQFRGWLERVGGPKAIADELRHLDNFPTPAERPDFYVDYGETGPYIAEVGPGECAS
ncbi:MAG: nitrite/sulfite reductase [Microthrixaceae bacterium]|nr:nitrite/sulfite reductase [Microthrixaceae bacterium]